MARPLVVARGAPSDRLRHTGEFTHKSAEIGTMHSARLARSHQARAACEQAVTLAPTLAGLSHHGAVSPALRGAGNAQILCNAHKSLLAEIP